MTKNWMTKLYASGKKSTTAKKLYKAGKGK